MMLYAALIEPFVEYGFMRRALVACLALALGAGPVGTFLVLRRMSLMGDAMGHAILPGAAIAFLVAGLSLWAMSLGGFVAGLTVALLAGIVSRVTALREDASLAGFYLISLALGVLIVVTLVTLAVIYRPLVIECFDPAFLRATTGGGTLWHFIFLTLVVLNLVAGFQALGTLMALGLMMLPAAAARFWAGAVWSLAALSIAMAFASGLIGLLISYNFSLPSGPSIILTAGGFYIGSILFGTRDSLRTRYFPRAHFHED